MFASNAESKLIFNRDRASGLAIEMKTYVVREVPQRLLFFPRIHVILDILENVIGSLGMLLLQEYDIPDGTWARECTYKQATLECRYQRKVKGHFIALQTALHLNAMVKKGKAAKIAGENVIGRLEEIADENVIGRLEETEMKKGYFVSNYHASGSATRPINTFSDRDQCSSIFAVQADRSTCVCKELISSNIGTVGEYNCRQLEFMNSENYPKSYVFGSTSAPPAVSRAQPAAWHNAVFRDPFIRKSI
ncbi:hypothetical protein C8R48DRAFT_680277 [Suillus tomentosus]|nr:hypothetical protein C8R48DRAFT_680277 [Suillus tomentosus]